MDKFEILSTHNFSCWKFATKPICQNFVKKFVQCLSENFNFMLTYLLTHDSVACEWAISIFLRLSVFSYPLSPIFPSFFWLFFFPLKMGSGASCHLWENFGNSKLLQMSLTLLGIVSSYQLGS